MYKIRDLGVKLVLHFGGEKQKIEGGGRVGYLEAGQSALLEIAFPSDREVWPVWPVRVDGQKNIMHAHDDSEVESVILCRTAIRLKESQSGVAHTQYPDNHVRLLRRVGPSAVELWEIALVSQNGVFWVTTQKTYSIAVGIDESGEFVCPQFAERWPQLVSFLSELFEDEELPVIADDPIVETPATLTENQGIVLWWNAAQQMGAIATAKGNARVHWSQIVAQNGSRRFLTPSQQVVFDHLRKPKVAPDGRPTEFNKEAVGVKPIAS